MKQILLLACFFMVSCEKNSLSSFCQAIIENDVTYARMYVDDILEDLYPMPDQNDYTGHFYNLESLVHEINRENCAFAQIRCYECIETFPPQSEIQIEINDDGYITIKVLDIATPFDSPMYFVGMHD